MKRYIAEFIGTFALVFCGTGSIIVNQQSEGGLGLIGISLAFGLVVTATIYMFGFISGAHINPAVTIALTIGKLFPKKELLGYLIAQLTGAILASITLFLLFPETSTMGETLPNGSEIQSFVFEVILTFFLMFTILTMSTNEQHAQLTGIVVGLLIVGMIQLSGPISGGSFNPARSLGPVIISGNYTSIWIYIIAPTLGATIASLLWVKVFAKE
jgi:aquaporin Z